MHLWSVAYMLASPGPCCSSIGWPRLPRIRTSRAPRGSRTFLPSGRSQASKSLASNAEQRTHPNVCGAPKTTLDVLKKRSNITNLYEQPIIL
jgi:hypothetical protein